MSNKFSWLHEPAGGVCTINGKNIHSEFGAYLKEHKFSAGAISANPFKTVGASKLKSSRYEVGFASLTITLYVGGATEEECSLNTSNIILEGQECIIKLPDAEFEYSAVLSSINTSPTGVDCYTLVELTFNAIKRYPQVTIIFDSGQGVFHNPGTAASGALIEIIPKTDLESLDLNGVQILRLSEGEKFTLDGLEGTVTCNGVNRFLDTDLIEFPKVYPGVNRIVSSSNEVTVIVSFYPTFSA